MIWSCVVLSIGCIFVCQCMFFFFKQKTAYELRISDWSSDVCSSDLLESDELLDEAEIIGLRGDAVGHVHHPLPGRLPHRQVRFGEGGVEIGRASCRERVCQYV